MRRSYQERQADVVQVGERVWYYANSLVHMATVTEARTFEPTNAPFTMYRLLVRNRDREQVHRSQIFRLPGERAELMAELDSDRDRLERYLEELNGREEDFIPDPERDDI